MNTRWILISALATLTWTGCQSIECGEGTVERDGHCAPANQMVDKAQCGPFTTLQGDKCVPMFPPTVCENGTTMADTDPTTGVTTCIGIGGGGCSAALACPNPAAGKQTICGQLYNLEDNKTFASATAGGAKCPTAPTADGPCALNIKAYDAIQFGTNPGTAVPLTVGEVYIDDCGRYRVTDITLPSGPFIGLGIDDAVAANAGPAGLTNTAGVATPKTASMATREFEAFVVPKSTTDKWVASGAPSLSGGYYVNIFRAHRPGPQGAELQAGVSSTRGGNVNAANDYYFQANQPTRETIVTSLSATGVNGTAIVVNASVAEGPTYSGTGGIPAECVWETKAGAAVPMTGSSPPIVLVQLFRPVNAVGQTCPL
jgi:hypothetical protein